jgi:hypothetical protein
VECISVIRWSLQQIREEGAGSLTQAQSSLKSPSDRILEYMQRPDLKDELDNRLSLCDLPDDAGSKNGEESADELACRFDLCESECPSGSSPGQGCPSTMHLALPTKHSRGGRRILTPARRVIPSLVSAIKRTTKYIHGDRPALHSSRCFLFETNETSEKFPT